MRFAANEKHLWQDLKPEETSKADDRAINERYGLAISGDENYSLEPAAFLIQEQNLRLAELNRLFNNCGIESLTSWIERHPDMMAFFGVQQRAAQTADKELSQFIEYRNDAAHGGLSVSDLAGIDIQLEYADFIALLCRIIAERVQREVLKVGTSRNLATEHGTVTELFHDGNVIVALLSGDFRVGQSIYLMTDSYCYERVIESIQLDGVAHDQVSVAGQELGMKLSEKGKKTAQF
jgi:RiboL-PSP-HEPN